MNNIKKLPLSRTVYFVFNNIKNLLHIYIVSGQMIFT